MMVARVAGYYDLPCITGAGANSAKEPGPQAAWENVVSFLLPSLAGTSFLFGVGLLDGSNLLTYEPIILDAELAAFLKRLLAPVADDESAVALSLIAELGADGVYMDRLHKVQNMRQALWLPELSDRDSYD